MQKDLLLSLTCEFRDGAPAAMAVLGYVVHELLILLRGPEPLPKLLLVAAGVPPHFSAMQNLRQEGSKFSRGRRAIAHGSRGSLGNCALPLAACKAS